MWFPKGNPLLLGIVYEGHTFSSLTIINIIYKETFFAKDGLIILNEVEKQSISYAITHKII